MLGSVKSWLVAIAVLVFMLIAAKFLLKGLSKAPLVGGVADKVETMAFD